MSRPGRGQRGAHGLAGVPADVAGGDVHRAHRERERRADQHHVAAGADQAAHAGQRAGVVLDVLQHVVGDQAGVPGPVLGGQHHLADADLRVAGHGLLELEHGDRVGVGRGEAADQRDPFPGVIAQAAADLDRAVPEVGLGEAGEPLPVISAFREGDQNVALDIAVTPDLSLVACHIPGGMCHLHQRCTSRGSGTWCGAQTPDNRRLGSTQDVTGHARVPLALCASHWNHPGTGPSPARPI